MALEGKVDEGDSVFAHKVEQFFPAFIMESENTFLSAVPNQNVILYTWL